MPLPELVRAFERETADQIRAILAAGEADAAAIIDAAARARSAGVTVALAESVVAQRSQADRELAAAQHQARAEVLAARTGVLERLREEVEARLPERVGEVGDALLAAALACAGDEPGTVRCAPLLVERVRRASPERSPVGDPAVTGVVIELASGVRIDATLSTLVDRDWAKLACDALRRLERP